MITPTPRAISPQDIVRIYVPPAPMDELKQNPGTPKSKSNLLPSTKDSKPNSLPVSEANNIQKQQQQQQQPHPNNYNNHNNIKIVSSIENLNANSNSNGNKKMSPSHTTTITTATTHQSSPPASNVWAPKTLTGLEQQGSNKNSIIYGSGDLTPVHCAFNRSDDDLIKSFADASLSTNSNSLGYIGITSSSSRRGSLSRKSPSAMFESNVLMECSHMIKRRLSSQSNSSINFELKTNAAGATGAAGDYASNAGNSSLSLRLNSPSNGDTAKRMTSFEQLAASSRYKKTHSDEKIHDETDKYSPDDEENYSYSYYKYKSAESRQRSPMAPVESSKRYVSESNVQYESISMRRESKELEYPAPNKQRPNSSGNETSLFQYESYTLVQPPPPMQKPTSIKEYKRFYGTSNEDNCDEELKKSSDESSSSPNCPIKSVLNSPDTIPLLQSTSPPSHIPIAKLKSPISPTHIYSMIGQQQIESPVKPSRIPVMHMNERRTPSSSTKCSPTAHISPNSSDLNRVLPPVEVISSSSSSNNSLSSRKYQKTSPTSPNCQTFVFTPNRPTKLPSNSKNGTAIGGSDSNTIRIKVNQSDKQ